MAIKHTIPSFDCGTAILKLYGKTIHRYYFKNKSHFKKKVRDWENFYLESGHIFFCIECIEYLGTHNLFKNARKQDKKPRRNKRI